MRILFAPALALFLIGAADAPAEPASPDQPATAAEPDAAEPRKTDCLLTIQQARATTGEPPLLDRRPASPDRPLAIYAVERLQDGCPVMVMMGNPGDVRPMPKSAKVPQLWRAPNDQ